MLCAVNFKKMKNTTVEELIEILKQMNPKAVVCHLELEDDKPIYSTFEICRQYDNVTYIDDDGDDVKGDVVAIY
jgi:UV DNA damage repair endonuclease